MRLLLRELLSSCSLQRLQIKGLCLLKLKIEQKFTGLYGRTIIVLTTAVPNKIINTQHFSSGKLSCIIESISHKLFYFNFKFSKSSSNFCN